MDEKSLWCWAGPWKCAFQHIISEPPLVLGDISWLQGLSVTAAFSMLWIQKMPAWAEGGQTDEPLFHSTRLNTGHVGWYKNHIRKATLQPYLIPTSKRPVSQFGRKEDWVRVGTVPIANIMERLSMTHRNMPTYVSYTDLSFETPSSISPLKD